MSVSTTSETVAGCVGVRQQRHSVEQIIGAIKQHELGMAQVTL